MWVHKTHTKNAWKNFFIYKEMLYTKYYIYGIIIDKYIRLLLGSQGHQFVHQNEEIFE